MSERNPGAAGVGEPRILRLDELEPRGHNGRSRILVDASIGPTSFTSGTSIFQPGVGVTLHSHNVEEMVMVLEGSGECEIEGEVYPVTARDSTYIPAGRVHCFRNTGDQPMTILWVYGSNDVTRTYANNGKTARILTPEDTPDL